MSISGITATDPAYQTAGAATVSPYQQDLQSLGKALQSGDLPGAQQSFAQMLKDQQNAGQSGNTAQAQGHHHHHHHKAASSSQGSSTQTASSAQGSTAATSSQMAQNLLSMPASGILPTDPSVAASSGVFL